VWGTAAAVARLGAHRLAPPRPHARADPALPSLRSLRPAPPHLLVLGPREVGLSPLAPASSVGTAHRAHRQGVSRHVAARRVAAGQPLVVAAPFQAPPRTSVPELENGAVVRPRRVHWRGEGAQVALVPLAPRVLHPHVRLPLPCALVLRDANLHEGQVRTGGLRAGSGASHDATRPRQRRLRRPRHTHARPPACQRSQLT
jgi:hypothetical protein